MGLLRKRVAVTWRQLKEHLRSVSFGAEMERHKQRVRQPRPRLPPIWWVQGDCTEESCVEDREKSRKPARPEALCQICRLCRAHCLGHRGIMEGLRPFLTVHNYG